MIVFDHVTKQFAGRKVLDDLSVTIAKGEVFTIVGPSGTGKSVTLKHIVRLLTPSSGTVRVDGADVNALSGKSLNQLRMRCGYLFQSGALLGWMSVAENIALPLRETTRMKEGAIRERVEEVLRLVGLDEDGDKLPSEISGGMRKRAGLARAIVRQPEIVLYDEPTSGLDPVTARTIDQLIKDLNRQLNITSIVVSHDLQGALMTADRVAMLTGGRFVEVSQPAEFVTTAQPDVRRFLDAQFIEGGIIERIKGRSL